MSLSKVLLREFQEKNYLYHFTSVENASEIIKTNTIYAGHNMSATNLTYKLDPEAKEKLKGISFTRDRELAYRRKQWISGVFGKPFVGFVFDRRKLKQKYKLYTFDVHGFKKYGAEYEKKLNEEIIIKDIENVRRLMEFIYIPLKYVTEVLQDISFFLMEFHMDLLEVVQKHNIEVKVFEKGNFRDVNLDHIDPSAGEEVLQQLYDEIFGDL